MSAKCQKQTFPFVGVISALAELARHRQSTLGCPLSAKSDFAAANLHLDLAKGAEL
jgi:hypothetical protein